MFPFRRATSHGSKRGGTDGVPAHGHDTMFEFGSAKFIGFERVLQAYGFLELVSFQRRAFLN